MATGGRTTEFPGGVVPRPLQIQAAWARYRRPLRCGWGVLALSVCACDRTSDLDDSCDQAVGGCHVEYDPVDDHDYGPEPIRYSTVLIIDVSSFAVNVQGTPGVDICGVEARCDRGETLAGDEAMLTPGDGWICTDDVPGCGADRSDANQALDSGNDCELESLGVSHYVSLGLAGILAVEFVRDLGGCTLSVVEADQEATGEAYDVYVCADEVGVDCLGGDDGPIHRAPRGGRTTFDVPLGE